MYSYGPLHMAKQKQDDQLEHTYSSYVRIRDVDLKTCQRRWTIGRSGERGSGISVLAARHDNDDDDDIYIYTLFCCKGPAILFLSEICSIFSLHFPTNAIKLWLKRVTVSIYHFPLKSVSFAIQCWSFRHLRVCCCQWIHIIFLMLTPKWR